nr:MAG TPA: hypothetical protein [Caudoviricetes sp.]
MTKIKTTFFLVFSFPCLFRLPDGQFHVPDGMERAPVHLFLVILCLKTTRTI